LRRPFQGELERVNERVQRFGGGAWRTIVARWPGLAELLRERRLVSARYRPQPAAQPDMPAPAPEATDALLAQLMAASAWEIRAGAALSLGHHRGDEVVHGLLRAVRDPSVEVAVAAIDALSHHEGQAATDGLSAVLQNAQGYFSPVTRVAALSSLAQRLGPDELAPIIAAVRDIDAEVSIAATAVLSERAPRTAASALLPVLRDNTGYYLPIVRLAVANALERSGGLHMANAQELLARESDLAVRRVLERASHLTGELSAE
jgi:HEAT repeat protein